jgi:hypothetical protein
MTWAASRSLEDCINIIRRQIIYDVQVVVGPKYIGWDRGGEIAPKLLLVSTSKSQQSTNTQLNAWLQCDILVLHINHSLRMSVTKVTLVRRPIVDFVLVKRVRDFIGEDACRETRYQLFCFVCIRSM